MKRVEMVAMVRGTKAIWRWWLQQDESIHVLDVIG